VTCLQAAYHANKSYASDTTKLRGIVVFAGRSLTGATRPNGTLSDWLEGANADGASPFTVRDGSLFFNRPGGFNDRIAVIDSN